MPRLKPGQERKGYANAGNPDTLPKGSTKSEIPEEDQELTEMESEFVRHYVLSWDAGKAAKAAGYSEKTAYSTGPKVKQKPRVAKAIKAHLAETVDDYRASREALVGFLLRIIYGDTTDLLEIVEETKGGKKVQVVKFKTTDVMISGSGQLINSITVGKMGIKVEIYSKSQAVEQLAKILGFYELDNNQKAAQGPNIYLPDNGRDKQPT